MTVREFFGRSYKDVRKSSVLAQSLALAAVTLWLASISVGFYSIATLGYNHVTTTHHYLIWGAQALGWAAFFAFRAIKRR